MLRSGFVNMNPASPRCQFQWHWFLRAQYPVLNVGSGEDPLGFGDDAVHVDILPFGHRYFVQADAEHLPLPDRSFHTVILGDIVEHVTSPSAVVQEAGRVSGKRLIMSIFEEWRLGGPGYHPPREDLSGHCWQFTDDMILQLCELPGFYTQQLLKEPENKYNGHTWYNWLICLERSTPCVS